MAQYIKIMTEEEFVESVVDMFSRTTEELLRDKIKSVLRSGCVDTDNLTIPISKALLCAFFESESENWTPHGASQVLNKFKKAKKAIKYYL